MQFSKLLITDSGGIQEEAPSLEVPALVVREKTERSAGLKRGIAALAGTSVKKITELAEEFLDNPPPPSAYVPNPYGDGLASERIVRILEAQSW